MKWQYLYSSIILFFFIWIPIVYTILKLKAGRKKGLLTQPGQSRVSIILLVFLFDCMLMAVFEFFAYSMSDLNNALLIYRILYVVMLFCPTIFTHLLFTYPIPNSTINPPWSTLIIYIPTIILTIFIISTDLILKGASHAEWGTQRVVGELFYLYRFLLLYVASLGFIVVIKNIIKYRLEPSVRNTLIHLLFSILVPLTYICVIVFLLPLVFNMWRLHVITPSMAAFLMAMYISYAIIRGHLLDFEALVGPFFKNDKYLFHQDLKKFIDGLTSADSLRSIIRQLSKLLECRVFLYVNVAGDKFVISSEKNKLNIPFLNSDIRKEAFNPEDQAIASFLKDYNAEQFFPIFHHHINGLIIFGQNFSRKIHSSQDIKLINKLCNELKDAILILWNKQRPSPILILKEGDELRGVVSDQCTEAKILDFKTFKEENIPTLNNQAFSEIMSSIISSRKFPAASILNLNVKIGEVVLIEVNGLPAVYAQVDNIQPAISHDEDLFIVTFLFLSTPPTQVVWNLSAGQLGGIPFMLEKKKVAITKLDSKKHPSGNVIPLPKYNKIRWKH